MLRLRVPHESAVDRVLLRFVRDGEPRAVEAERDAETETETWWRASFPVLNPSTPYRWLLDRGDERLLVGDRPRRLVAATSRTAATSCSRSTRAGRTGTSAPSSTRSSPTASPPPEPARARRCPSGPCGASGTRVPRDAAANTPRELFGGDLPGIEQRLDHIEQLGVNALYLTPVFPAGSTHRYDATSFDHVDPLLGGDAALASLVAAAHMRGIRVIGDLTLNHCGAGHDWFIKGREDVNSPERDFFYFDGSFPHGYVSWFGVKSLPKLDHRSHELRRRFLDGPESITGRWLRPPDGFDGWRIDVANMAGRHHDLDLTVELARAMRATLAGSRSDALLVAEHGHDFRGDLQGFGWHGTMNYAGFLRPVWEWLRGDELPQELRRSFWGLPVGLPHAGGRDATAVMRAFRAGVPWPSTAHSWALLDSHDTARFRTVAGDRGRQIVGVGLQMTTPGVPMVFAGDELGLEGDWGEDARRTMPWDAPERWDEPLLEAYRTLIRAAPQQRRARARRHPLRRTCPTTRSRTSASRATSSCSASRRARRTTPITVPFTELETLYGEDARNGVLPADGPAFHIWRIPNG